MLGSVYHFTKDDVSHLTLLQINAYLSMIPYVHPWSEKFGKPEEARNDAEDKLVQEMLCQT